MTFAWAIDMLISKNRVFRSHWNQGEWIKLQVPDSQSMMSAPYIFMHSGIDMFPWTPTHADLLASDWDVF